MGIWRFDMRSFSINEWCELHGLSRPFFYTLEKNGEAPKTFPVGRHRRISESANAQWIALREATPVDPSIKAKRSAIGRSNVAARKDRLAVQP
jgi:excisionase family DNA binding protein